MSFFDNETYANADPYHALSAHVFDDENADVEEREIREAEVKEYNKRLEHGCVYHRVSTMTMDTEVPSGSYYSQVAVRNSVAFTMGKDGKLRADDDSGTIDSAVIDIVKGSSNGDSVTHMFVDPLGRHCILVLNSGKNKYVHFRANGKATKHDLAFDIDSQQAAQPSTTQDRLSSLFNPLSQLTSLVTGDDKKAASTTVKITIESVAWDENNTFESSSGTVLLGTKAAGNILSARFDASGMQGAKTIFTFPTSSTHQKHPPIAAISMSLPKERRSARPSVVLAAVLDKLYYFVGKGEAEAVMAEYTKYDVLHNYRQIQLDIPVPSPSSVPVVPQNLSLRFLIPPRAKPTNNALVFNWAYGSILVQGRVLIDAKPEELPTIAETEKEAKKVVHARGRGAKGQAQQGQPNRTKGKGMHLLQDEEESDLKVLPTSLPNILHVVNELHFGQLMYLEKEHEISTQPHSAPATPASPFSAKKELTKKILDITATPLFIAVTTEEKIVLLAQSALLPWKSGASLLQHSKKGGGATAPVAAAAALMGSTGSPASPLGGPGSPSSPTTGSGMHGEAIRGVDVANRTVFTYSLVRSSGDATSRKLLYKKDGAVGMSYDFHRNRFIAFSSTEVMELAPVPVRIGFVSLFVQSGVDSFAQNARRQRKKLQAATASMIQHQEDAQAQAKHKRAASPRQPRSPRSRRKEKEDETKKDKKDAALTIAKKGEMAPDQYFTLALTIAGKNKRLERLVHSTFARCLWAAKLHYRASEALSHYDDFGIDEAVVLLSGLPTSTEPLQAYVRNRLNQFQSNRVHFDENATELAVLTSLQIHLLVDQCNRDAVEKLATAYQTGGNGGALSQPGSFALSRNPTITSVGSANVEEEVEPTPPMVPHFCNLEELLQEKESSSAVAVDDTATLAECRSERSFKTSLSGVTTADLQVQGGVSGTEGVNAPEQRALQPEEELSEMLSKYSEHVQWHAIHRGVLAIGNEEQINFVCYQQKKLEEVMESLVLRERYYDAVCTLINDCAAPEFLELWRKHSYTLIRYFPVKLIRHGWIPLGRTIGIVASDLLAALCYYQQDDNEKDAVLPDGKQEGAQIPEHMGIEYLNHVIDVEGESEGAVHDLLLLFLARQKPAGDVGETGDETLVRLIQSSRYYDQHYAMRICAQYARLHAMAELYFQLQSIPLAVDTALHCIQPKGVDVAKAFIHRVNRDLRLFEAEDDPVEAARKLRVSLWRTLIAVVARYEGGSRNALLLLSESNDEVNVSDVLPHFSDEVMILEFKDELAENVKKFQHMMTETEKAIAKANSNAVDLRHDFNVAKASVARISATKKCDVCHQPALSRSMVIFRTCGHVFHTRCYSNTRSISAECCLCSVDSITQVVTEPLASSALAQALR